MKKAFILSIFFTIVSIALSLAFKSMTATLFSKGDLAVFYSVLDLVGLFMLLFIGFRASMTVSFHKGVEVGGMLNLFRIIIGFVAVLGCVASFFILESFGVGISFLNLFGMFAAFALYTYFSNQLGMYRLYTETNVITILEPLALMGWFAVLFFWLEVKGVEVLYLAAPMGMLTTALYIGLKKMRLHAEPPFFLPSLDEKLKVFLKNSALGGAEFVFGMLILYLAVLFVGRMLSLEALGEFQVVVKSFFMYYISIFVFPIVKFILPELSMLVEKKDFGSIAKLGRFAFLYAVSAGAAAFLFSAFLGETLITGLFGALYLPSYIPLVILSAAIVFVTINTYQVALLKSLDRFLLSTAVRATGSVIFPVFAFCIYPFAPSLEGVSAALLLSYAVMAVISYYFSKAEMKKLALKD